MDNQQIKSYADYNLWANQQIIAILKQLSDDQLDQVIVNSFPSITKTISHIWLAEYLWLKRWQGTSLKTFPFSDFKGTHHQRFEEVLKTSTAIKDYVATINQSDLAEGITIQTLEGNEYSHTRHQLIHHCLNHSTYHRGQLVMMCKQLGIQELGPFDYIWYLRQKDATLRG
jgi:uncharacterized damage-inducible protein DinB